MASTSISVPPMLSRKREGNDSSNDEKRLKLDSDSTTLQDKTDVEKIKTREKSKSMRDAAGWAKSRKGKEKDGRHMGRNSRRGTRPERETEDASDGGSGVKAPRLPKRQCALLIGFCGTGCNGMQMYVFKDSDHTGSSSSNDVLLPRLDSQPNVRTIEGVLFDAMVKAHAVSEDNSDDPVKVLLNPNASRALHTDSLCSRLTWAAQPGQMLEFTQQVMWCR